LAWQAVVWALLAAGGATAQEDASRDTAVAPGRPLVDHRGYRLLVDKAYLPPDFDQETFDRVWEHWPAELRQAASQASPEQRRRMAFTRYGLTGRPDAPDQPLQYVVDAQGQWTMNCLACHGGSVPDGRGGQVVWPGAPNSRYALQTLTEETRLVKVALRKPLSRMDLGSIFIPLGTTHGTTNAVMFGVALMALREPDLSLRRERTLPPMTHHDMDAPPWWHLRRKTKLYIDGFASRGHRPLMQFMLVPQNGPQQFRAWEADFRDVLDYLLSLSDRPRASRAGANSVPARLCRVPWHLWAGRQLPPALRAAGRREHRPSALAVADGRLPRGLCP
jgi:mono/diheme cytochrome c family protein